jgi:hypothetical protein
VLELEGCNRPVAGASQDREGHERPVAALDFRSGRHRSDDVSDLLQGRHTRVPMGLGDPRLFRRQVEIFGIGVRNPGLVPRLSGQPDEEPLQGAERGVERRLAESLVGPKARLFGQVRLEPPGLLDVKRLEVPESGVGLEPVQGLRDAVERGLASVLMLRKVPSQRLSEHRFGRDMRDILEITLDRRPRDDEPHEIRGF